MWFLFVYFSLLLNTSNKYALQYTPATLLKCAILIVAVFSPFRSSILVVIPLDAFQKPFWLALFVITILYAHLILLLRCCSLKKNRTSLRESACIIFFSRFLPFLITFYSRYSPTRENQDEILDKKNDHQIPVSILCAFLSPPMWLHRPMSTRVCLYLTVLQKMCVSDCAHERRQQQTNPKNQTNLSLKY